MENNKKKESRSRLILILSILVVLMLLVAIASKTFPNFGTSDALTEGSEASQTETKEIINNSSDIEKLKSSEYTSSGFEKIQIGDSIDTVEENIGTLEKLNVDSEYDAYVFNDEELGSNYVFYFSNNELKEVSVFLAQ